MDRAEQGGLRCAVWQPGRALSDTGGEISTLRAPEMSADCGVPSIASFRFFGTRVDTERRSGGSAGNSASRRCRGFLESTFRLADGNGVGVFGEARGLGLLGGESPAAAQRSRRAAARLHGETGPIRQNYNFLGIITCRFGMVARDGIEPPTPAFSGLRSTS